jgi:hypothetical protein
LRIKNLVVVVVAEPRLHTTFKSAVEALLVLFKLAHTNIKVLKWAVDEITNKDVWSFFYLLHKLSQQKKSLKSENLCHAMRNMTLRMAQPQTDKTEGYCLPKYGMEAFFGWTRTVSVFILMVTSIRGRNDKVVIDCHCMLHEKFLLEAKRSSCNQSALDYPQRHPGRRTQMANILDWMSPERCSATRDAIRKSSGCYRDTGKLEDEIHML